MIAVRLGLADLWHERTVFACFVLALTAFLAPLLVLYGLKFGVITALLDTLRNHPDNLEVLVLGNHQLAPGQIEALRRRPEIGFLVPTTRSIAARLFFQATGGRGGGRRAQLMPTAAGDPLLPAGTRALADAEVVLSRALAQDLGLEAGDTVVGFNERMTGVTAEPLRLPLTVLGVLDEAILPGHRALITLPTLKRIEAFLDGYAVPELGIPGADPGGGPVTYANFRLYARTLDDLEPLVRYLGALGFEVRSKASEVRSIKLLDDNLAVVFAIVALVGGGGYLVSLGASLWANVERKRRHLSVLRLIGATTRQLIFFPIIQSLCIAVVGVATSIAFFFAASETINRLFADTALGDGAICQLAARHFALAFVGTVVAAAVAALAGGIKAAALEPTEGLQNG